MGAKKSSKRGQEEDVVEKKNEPMGGINEREQEEERRKTKDMGKYEEEQRCDSVGRMKWWRNSRVKEMK